jgi:hypothetical protein
LIQSKREPLAPWVGAEKRPEWPMQGGFDMDQSRGSPGAQTENVGTDAFAEKGAMAEAKIDPDLHSICTPVICHASRRQFMKANVGNLDRAIRAALGLALLRVT